MNKAIIFLLDTLCICALSSCNYVKRDPEQILRNQTKQFFGLNIDEIHPEILSFEENWSWGGDGYLTITFKFTNECKFINLLRPLPITELIPIDVPKGFKETKYGYYILHNESSGMNYEVLILNLENHEGVLNYVNF